jgi:hypothetical protein
MRGSHILLILILGWVVMYFVLTRSIPEHLRKQTEEMPGTRKSGPLVVPSAGAEQPTDPGARASEIRLLFSAPEGAESLGLVILQLYRQVGGKQVLDVDSSVLVTGMRLEQRIEVTDPSAAYTLRAVAQAKDHPLWGPVVLEGLAPGAGPVEVRFPPAR